MAKKVVENHSVFSSYLTNDLTDSQLSTRLNYCDYFKRPGTFLFKTGGHVQFTKYKMTSVHRDKLQQCLIDCSEAVQFSIPRYCVTSDELYVIDMLEYMNKVLLFPLNALYNVDLSSNNKILLQNQIILCPDVIRDIFHDRSSCNEHAFDSSVNTTSNSVPLRRSAPIYVSDNYIVLPQFRNQKKFQATKIQIFS